MAMIVDVRLNDWPMIARLTAVNITPKVTGVCTYRCSALHLTDDPKDGVDIPQFEVKHRREDGCLVLIDRMLEYIEKERQLP